MAKMVTDLKQSVIEALKHGIGETLRRSGREIPEFNNYDLRPIVDFAGFDSQCGIEVTVELEAILKIDDLSDNIFIKELKGRPRARTFTEIVDAILALMDIQQ